jgi:hypothetical protein
VSEIGNMNKSKPGLDQNGEGGISCKKESTPSRRGEVLNIYLKE